MVLMSIIGHISHLVHGHILFIHYTPQARLGAIDGVHFFIIEYFNMKKRTRHRMCRAAEGLYLSRVITAESSVRSREINSLSEGIMPEGTPSPGI